MCDYTVRAAASESRSTIALPLAGACAESRIESYLKRHGVSSDDFFAALLAAEQATCATLASRKSLAASLLLVEDFEAFAKICQQRALEK